VQHFSFESAELEGLKVIKSFCADDNRGYLVKDYEREVYLQNGIDAPLQECFYTKSYKGVIRANHFQMVYPQKKLIRVIYGEIYDVVVDLRKNSKTFGEWQGFYLSEQNKTQLYIPEGFSHGYLVLSDISIVSYKCSGKFYSKYDGGIMWDDPDLSIEWPIHLVNEVILGEKDKNLPSFKEFIKLGAF